MSRGPACSPRHRRFCSPAHETLVSEYRDAHAAREALRESSSTAPTAFTFGSLAGHNQLESDDFDAAVPPVLFKDWLIEHAHPRDVADWWPCPCGLWHQGDYDCPRSEEDRTTLH